MTARPRSVSVLMPTFQGAAFLDRVLTALLAQELDLPFGFLAIDSGSSDGTLEILERHRQGSPVPFAVRRIDPVEFDHGDTRNLLAAWSEGELLVYLTQDAIPAGPDWLATLVANFDDARVGAATCRNVARPDAELLTQVFSESDPGYAADRREVRLPDPATYAAMDATEKRLLYNFNDVASAIRRSLWELHPFPRTSFGEDVLMARGLLEAGHTVVHDERACVEHSHDYDVAETRARARTDGEFNARWLGRTCVASPDQVRELVRRQLVRDREALEASGLVGTELTTELERAGALREAAFGGLHEGGKTRERLPATRSLERTHLKILYVVHGFPPDTWAGTEVYTLNLARAMKARGHEVVILTRAPAERALFGPKDFQLAEDEFEGLRVVRMTHRLKHRNLRESYDQPRAVEAFTELVQRETPDLVHFQHLIHLSGGLVQRARELGLPTILHCHDYWALCARVQMIRPDGKRCDHNMGSGCFLCVKERELPEVERLSSVDATAPAEVRAALEIEPGFWEGFEDLAARHEFLTSAYASADLLISPSRFLRSKLLESGEFEPSRFLYSDNGMRTDLVAALDKRPDSRVRFGFVGSLVWYKGCDVMIDAMNLLAGEPCALHVFGAFEPESDDYHRRLAERCDPGAKVEFRGRFDNSRLSEVYTEIDVLVVPSVWFENSPITIHEAFLAGTPVVASDIGGMAEYVRDGVDGLHFRTGDARDLARVMRRFADEPDLRERLSQDFMEVKSIEDNARETEFRYRALCCQVRTTGPRVWIEARGPDTAERTGPVEEQGDELLLLRPGGEANYDVQPARGGPRTIRVEVQALGGERDVELGGVFLLDGVPLGGMEPFRAGAQDEVRAFELDVDLAAGARRLTARAGEGSHLRLRRVIVGDRDPARGRAS